MGASPSSDPQQTLPFTVCSKHTAWITNLPTGQTSPEACMHWCTDPLFVIASKSPISIKNTSITKSLQVSPTQMLYLPAWTGKLFIMSADNYTKWSMQVTGYCQCIFYTINLLLTESLVAALPVALLSQRMSLSRFCFFCSVLLT